MTRRAGAFALKAGFANKARRQARDDPGVLDHDMCHFSQIGHHGMIVLYCSSTLPPPDEACQACGGRFFFASPCFAEPVYALFT